MVVEKMYDIPVSRAWVQEEERGEAILQNDDNKNSKQVDTDGEKEEVSPVNQVCFCWFWIVMFFRESIIYLLQERPNSSYYKLIIAFFIS